MTISEAERIKRSFYRIEQPTEDDIFLFTEAMEFLIDKKHDPNDMLDLGGYYYGAENFRLAQKYYEMAAEYKLPDAYICLGYIFYYGRTGEPDYEKAFHYYSLGKESGSITAAYKLADMYKNGYAVEKDPAKYKEIIEELYPKVARVQYLNEPLPEIYTRLARIRTEEGETEEAEDLYWKAKDFLAQRISYDAFFGNLSIMKGLIRDLYQLTEFDEDDFDLFDLYYLLRSPVTVRFRYNGQAYEIRAEEEDGEFSIFFNGRYFRDCDGFFSKAEIGGQYLVSINGELYDFEVI